MPAVKERKKTVVEVEVPRVVEDEIRDLLDALDRMYGSLSLSQNVRRAASELRRRFPADEPVRDRRDMSKAVK